MEEVLGTTTSVPQSHTSVACQHPFLSPSAPVMQVDLMNLHAVFASYCLQVLLTPPSVPQLETTVADLQKGERPPIGGLASWFSQIRAPFMVAHPFASGMTVSRQVTV